jgi:hypothetical protein
MNKSKLLQLRSHWRGQKNLVESAHIEIKTAEECVNYTRLEFKDAILLLRLPTPQYKKYLVASESAPDASTHSETFEDNRFKILEDATRRLHDASAALEKAKRAKVSAVATAEFYEKKFKESLAEAGFIEADLKETEDDSKAFWSLLPDIEPNLSWNWVTAAVTAPMGSSTVGDPTQSSMATDANILPQGSY